MITVGILVSYLIALLVFHVSPGAAYGADWRVILGLGAIPALLALVLRARMPESPRWLMLQGRFADTKKALGLLGIEVSEEQVRHSAEQLAATETKERKQHKSRWTPGVKRALIVVCVFFIFQQITGINIPFYYGPKLLAGLFRSGAQTTQVAVDPRGEEGVDSGLRLLHLPTDHGYQHPLLLRPEAASRALRRLDT